MNILRMGLTAYLVPIAMICLVPIGTSEAKCSRNSGNEFCKAGRAATTAREQAETNLDNLGHGISVTGKDLGRHTAQFVENTIRLFSEDRCDAVKRKRGEAAKRRCLAESETQSAKSPPPNSYYAAAEIECYKRGRDSRWGTRELRVWSKISLEDARRIITDQTSTGSVCATWSNDVTLYDGPWRWLN